MFMEQNDLTLCLSMTSDICHLLKDIKKKKPLACVLDFLDAGVVEGG